MSFRVSCKVFPKERKNYRRPLHRPKLICDMTVANLE